jgi:hydrogenase/urease accessory protein HupE
MLARTYRSVPDVEPARREPLDSAMAFVGTITWMAALGDVVGVAGRHAPFRGLDALALVALLGLTLAFLRVAFGRLRRWSRQRA